MDENVESTVVVLLILKNMGLGEGGEEGKKMEMGKHMGVGEEEG